MKLPSQVVAADWSVTANKRMLCRAILRRTGYEVLAPEEVGNTDDLLQRLRQEVNPDAATLIGFDFPIGLPSEYASRAGFLSFPSALRLLGKDRFRDFYDVSSSPTIHQPFYPPPCKRRGQYTRNRLIEALKAGTWTDLLRRCDRATSIRRAASCLFFTLGGQQVGRAAAHGWKSILAPNVDSIRLWPFDGDLPTLLAGRNIVACEIYPAEAYSHFGIPPKSAIQWSKRKKTDRQAVTDCLLSAADKANCALSTLAHDSITDGFQSDDQFDAMVGLLFMIHVVTGLRPWTIPDDASISKIEGWILGMDSLPGASL